MTDRTVHASDAHVEIVRYDRAGKWYFESKDGKAAQLLPSVDEAVGFALRCIQNGGRVHLGCPGGRTFERKVQGRLHDKPATDQTAGKDPSNKAEEGKE